MDIAIVGGNVAGAFAAIQLRGSAHRITIFDPKAPWEKPCGGCVQADVFERFPLLRELSCGWHYPARLRLVSSGGEQTLAFTPASGWATVSRRDLNRSLLDMALGSDNVRLVQERVSHIARGESGWILRTADGTAACADLLIGADGVTSVVRKALVRPLPREHLGLTVCYLLQGSAPDEAVVKTFADLPGYLWHFPRQDHASAGIGTRLVAASAGDLWRRLDDFLADYCPAASKVSRWGALIPCVSSPDFWDGPCAGDDWAVIGDAAGHVHPLTEAGLYYALFSAELVAQAILAGDIRGYDTAWRRAYGQPLRQASAIIEQAGTDYARLERLVQKAVGALPAVAHSSTPVPLEQPGGDDDDLPRLRTDVTARLSGLRTLRGYGTLQTWLSEWLAARLPPWSEFALVCNRLAGGCPPADLARLLSAWMVLFSVSGPLDDYADQDKCPDGAWADLGWQRGIFVALALIEEAYVLLEEERGDVRLAGAARVLHKRLLESALGQAMDVAQVQTLEAYEQMLELKAATLTAALTESVAVLAGAEGPRKRALVTCGRELGMALQIVNDYLGVWRPDVVGKTGGGDLAQPQLTYPVFYALTVPHAYRAEFQALLGCPPRGRDTGRMLEILNAIGAPRFMRAAIELRQGRALRAAREISPECTAGLARWCNRHLLGEGRSDVE